MTERYDLIVIGSGPGGYKSAVIAAQLGHKVALIEKAKAGGTCLNQGCVPKEALVRIAKLVSDVESFEGLGIHATISADFEQAIHHKNKLVSSIQSDVAPWLKRLGIKFIEASARFQNSTCVELIFPNGNADEISADRIIIATGSHVRSLPELPCDGKFIINSRQLIHEVTTLPKKILCVGGGSIGSELSFVFHQFGADVTVIEKASRLLDFSCMPDRASQALERKFKKLGITVRKNEKVESYKIEDNKIHVTFSDNTIELFDMIFVAVGREANTSGLNLENANVAVTEDGFIETNEYLETTCDGIYAIGDVKAGPMTANAAFHDAKIATGNALSGNQAEYNYHRVPLVIDSALQIATVGLTEDWAEEAGFEPDVARINLAGTTKAHLTQELEGFIEVVHDEETGQLLGGCVIGPQAKEMIHTITAACQSKRGLWFFTDLNYAHPSWNEELENAIYSYVNTFSKSSDSVFQPGIYAID